MKRHKIAKVPADIWDDRKRTAALFGFKEATRGFLIKEELLKKIITGQYLPKEQYRTGKKSKYTVEIEFENI